MTTPDTPTLLANASAADLEAAAASVELSLKPRSGVVLAIADLRLLAELARAVAEMDRRAVAYSPGPMRQWNADTEGCVTWVVAAPPRSLFAALAATRHTQGEADVQAR